MIPDFVLYCVGVAALFFVLAAVRKLASKEGLSSFLISFSRRGLREAALGGAVAVGTMLIYVAYEVFLEGAVFATAGASAGGAAVYVALIVLYCLCVAFFEEALYRGYGLSLLMRRLPAPAAAAITAAVFACYHLLIVYRNAPDAPLGALNVFLIGCALSALVIRRGTLMIGIGFHFAYNLGLLVLAPIRELGLSVAPLLDVGDVPGYDATTEPAFTIAFGLVLLWAVLSRGARRT